MHQQSQLFLVVYVCLLASSATTTTAWTYNNINNRIPSTQQSRFRLKVSTHDLSSDSSAESSSSSPTTSSTAAKFSDVDWDWAAVAENVFQHDTRPIVLFDGVCNLCSGGVNFAIDHDEDAKLRFTSLQSKVAQSLLLRSGSDPKEANIVLVTEDAAYFSSDAVSRICLQLDTPSLKVLGQVGMILPNWFREALYKYVSTNRYFFGENDQCRIDFDGTYTSRFVSDPVESS